MYYIETVSRNVWQSWTVQAPSFGAAVRAVAAEFQHSVRIISVRREP